MIAVIEGMVPRDRFREGRSSYKCGFEYFFAKGRHPRAFNREVEKSLVPKSRQTAVKPNREFVKLADGSC